MINSILDNDLYKFSMQQAVLELFPRVEVSYVFNNRDKTMQFNKDFYNALMSRIQSMSFLSLSSEEYHWLKEKVRVFKPSYLEYLKNFRFDPREVFVGLTPENDLKIDIHGPWHKTILWEVPLMSTISELYFEMIDQDWNYDNQKENMLTKSALLTDAGCSFADFGTRRRRSYGIQDFLVQTLMEDKNSTFVGTSNVHLAQKHNTRPIGTMAHEWIMGISSLRGLRHANHSALYNWVKVYGADLGIALTDTFGTEAFFKDFDLKLAKEYDGVRHDSGNPFAFTDLVIDHYKKLRIDPLAKTIVFSDGLDVQTAIEIKQHCVGRIKCSFGIGTNLTNDFKKFSTNTKSKPLNMVIKLSTCDGVPVVKLSDNPSKAIGDPDALRVAKWTFNHTPLDE